MRDFQHPFRRYGVSVKVVTAANRFGLLISAAIGAVLIHSKGFEMNRKWAVIWAALSVITVSGCASMSSEECANSDWTAVGYEDGSRGYTSDSFSNRRKACAKHGVTADFQAYQNGRDQGLVEYCQPGRGFNVGESGGSYNGVCSAALEQNFVDAYNVGRQLYNLRSNVNNASSKKSSKESEIDSIKDSIRRREAALIAPETSTEDRILLLADIKEMSESIGELEEEIQLLVADRARYRTPTGIHSSGPRVPRPRSGFPCRD